MTERPFLTLVRTRPKTTEQKMDAYLKPCQLLADDRSYMLSRLPVGGRARKRAIEQYKLIWVEAMDAEPLENRKQNAGRFVANIWLRHPERPITPFNRSSNGKAKGKIIMPQKPSKAAVTIYQYQLTDADTWLTQICPANTLEEARHSLGNIYGDRLVSVRAKNS